MSVIGNDQYIKTGTMVIPGQSGVGQIFLVDIPHTHFPLITLKQYDPGATLPTLNNLNSTTHIATSTPQKIGSNGMGWRIRVRRSYSHGVMNPGRTFYRYSVIALRNPRQVGDTVTPATEI